MMEKAWPLRLAKRLPGVSGADRGQSRSAQHTVRPVRCRRQLWGSKLNAASQSAGQVLAPF
jgi:hypothetical protein